MIKSIHNTKGIIIEVEPHYDGDLSEPNGVKFIFTYSITIKNNSETDVQLISRKWEIFDSIGETHTVEGEGVVGEQPIIEKGESYSYSSWCPLDSNLGSMQGHYVMKNLLTQELFHAEIPKFELAANWILN
ncbi:MAG: Co2+/Mg2+ efflux protein ApaG [Bacteroidota bacterium]